MISFEDFLLQPSKVIDPFNRFISKIDPFIMMVEFCQVIGPRPLAVVSSRANDEVANVDINEMAIWLMSSDIYPGTLIVLENNQTGIYAAAYYFNLYDIRARAFQRNLCIAYLSSEKPGKEVLGIFSKAMRKLVSPILICNRKLFIRHVMDICKFSDTIDETTLQQYYTLHGEPNKFPDVGRFNVVFEQTRLLKSRFLTKKFQDMIFEDDICTGHNIENLNEAEEIICSFRVPSVPLSPVDTLTPCAYHEIVPKMRNILAQCKKALPAGVGALYSAGRPIAKLPRAEGYSTSSASRLESDTVDGEETLRAITCHLGEVLYPILSGEDLVVCGNPQRLSTVNDMLQKLSTICPQSTSRIIETPLESDPHKIGNGLGGLQCTRSETGKLARWRHILDMNRCILKTFAYDGCLLNGLKKKRRFPTDRSVIYFVIAYLTNLCSLVYVCRYCRNNELVPEFDRIEPNVTADDRRLLTNLLVCMDFEKFNTLKTSPSKDAVKPSKIINL
ncbi:unnamed protein product [Caenorhabditis bovis]|uniref:UDENN FLCN/SMCR8-type domain-containing protein n=1 Tax=Caenorhabditis bovis TaxID=2654633 RepID=A0A8S1EQ92_9PELO|nr:unnamed protein product [Caenorhabditis bovis]